MRKYVNGDEQIFMEWEEYARAVQTRTVPPLIETAMQLWSRSINPSQSKLIAIEQVSSMRSLTYWKVSFRVGHVEVAYAGRKLGDHMEHISLRVYDTYSDQVVLDVKANAKTGRLEGMDVNKKYSQPRLSKIPKPAPAFQHRKNPKIVLDTNEYGQFFWRCDCWLPGENYCGDIKGHFYHMFDRADINKNIHSGRRTGSFLYPIARGATTVQVFVECFDRKEVFDEEGPDVLRMSHEASGLSMWLDEPDLAGRQLLVQVKGIAQEDKRYSALMEMAGTGPHPFAANQFAGYKCPHRYHSPRDNKALLVMATGFDPNQIEDFAFANTYSEIFYGKCLSCANVEKNMGNDIPGAF